MKKLTLIISIAALIIFFGCDKENKDESNKDSEPKVTNNNELKNKERNENKDGNNDDFSENMKKLKDMMSGGENIKVVNFRKLKDFLPEKLDEMNRVSAGGENTNAFGINVSQVEGKYQSEDGKETINIKIMDMGSMKGLAGMTAFAWSWAEIDKESDEGFERTFEYKGHKAFEKYNTKYQDGEVQVLVAKRFMVELKGNDVSIEKIHSVLDEVNIGDLESMKDEGKKAE